MPADAPQLTIFPWEQAALPLSPAAAAPDAPAQVVAATGPVVVASWWARGQSAFTGPPTTSTSSAGVGAGVSTAATLSVSSARGGGAEAPALTVNTFLDRVGAAAQRDMVLTTAVGGAAAAATAASGAGVAALAELQVAGFRDYDEGDDGDMVGGGGGGGRSAVLTVLRAEAAQLLGRPLQRDEMAMGEARLQVFIADSELALQLQRDEGWG